MVIFWRKSLKNKSFFMSPKKFLEYQKHLNLKDPEKFQKKVSLFPWSFRMCCCNLKRNLMLNDIIKLWSIDNYAPQKYIQFCSSEEHSVFLNNWVFGLSNFLDRLSTTFTKECSLKHLTETELSWLLGIESRKNWEQYCNGYQLLI